MADCKLAIDIDIEVDAEAPLHPADPEYIRALSLLADRTLVAAVRRMDPAVTHGQATPLAQALALMSTSRTDKTIATSAEVHTAMARQLACSSVAIAMASGS